MSKEAYTPIVDSYRDAEELPEHIKNYTDHPYDEAELRDLGRLNRDFEGVFTVVSSQEFEKAYEKFAERVNSARQAAIEVTDDVATSNAIKAAQIKETTTAALNEAARKESQELLPLQNPKDLKLGHKLQRQRLALEEVFKRVVALNPDGQLITDTPAYKQLLQHWRRYEQLGFAFEVGKLREQAIRQDEKNFRPKKHLKYAREVGNDLNAISYGLFGRIRSLPVDRYHIPTPGGETSYRKIATNFIKQKKRSASKVKDRTDEENQIALYTLADNEIEPLMRELEAKYRADGLDPYAINQRLEVNRQDLQDWLTDDKLREMFFNYDIAANIYDARSRD